MIPFVPPSTVTQLLPQAVMAPNTFKYGAIKTPFFSNLIVMGLPLKPLPFTAIACPPADPVIVPHKCTVVPGPIWLVLPPQLPAVLTHVKGSASAQSAPFAEPVAF